MATAIETAPPVMTSTAPPKAATEHTPPPSASATAPPVAKIQLPPAEPSPPASQSGHKESLSADTPVEDASPPFSPSSTTPVLEKDDLEFNGNVDVNDDIPTDKDMKRIDDLLVLDSKGVSRPFKDLYRGEGVAPRQLIIFVRHFFCGNCQEFLRTLSSSITPESLLALPTPTFITVIGCGEYQLIDMYVKETNCQFPVYAEPTRKLYDNLAMTRTWDLGKKPSYIQSNLIINSLQSIMQAVGTGNKALKGGDFKQVGGEFLFEEGECVWAHRMKNTRDHTEVTQIRAMLGLDGTPPPLRKRWSHGIKKVREHNKSMSWRSRSRSKSKSKSVKGKDSLDESEKPVLNGAPTV